VRPQTDAVEKVCIEANVVTRAKSPPLTNSNSDADLLITNLGLAISVVCFLWLQTQQMARRLIWQLWSSELRLLPVI
jgi:hypothetical protein